MHCCCFNNTKLLIFIHVSFKHFPDFILITSFFSALLLFILQRIRIYHSRTIFFCFTFDLWFVIMLFIYLIIISVMFFVIFRSLSLNLVSWCRNCLLRNFSFEFQFWINVSVPLKVTLPFKTIYLLVHFFYHPHFLFTFQQDDSTFFSLPWKVRLMVLTPPRKASYFYLWLRWFRGR